MAGQTPLIPHGPLATLSSPRAWSYLACPRAGPALTVQRNPQCLTTAFHLLLLPQGPTQAFLPFLALPTLWLSCFWVAQFEREKRVSALLVFCCSVQF